MSQLFGFPTKGDDDGGGTGEMLTGITFVGPAPNPGQIYSPAGNRTAILTAPNSIPTILGLFTGTPGSLISQSGTPAPIMLVPGESPAAGDPLYLSPSVPGSATTVAPAPPNQRVYVGTVVDTAGYNSMTGGTVLSLFQPNNNGGTSVFTDTGLVPPELTPFGTLCYLAGDNSLGIAVASDISRARVYGVYSDTNTVVTAGVTNVFFPPGLTLNGGDRIFLSSTAAGYATNVEPSAPAISAELGFLRNNTGYDSMAGSLLPVLFRPFPPLTLT